MTTLPLPGQDEPMEIGVFTTLEMVVAGLREPQEWPTPEAFAAAATSLGARGYLELQAEEINVKAALRTIADTANAAEALMITTTTDGLVVTALAIKEPRSLLVEAVADEVHTFVLAPPPWYIDFILSVIDVPARQPSPDDGPPRDLDAGITLELYKQRDSSELLIDTVVVLTEGQRAWLGQVTDLSRAPAIAPASGADVRRSIRRMTQELLSDR